MIVHLLCNKYCIYYSHKHFIKIFIKIWIKIVKKVLVEVIIIIIKIVMLLYCMKWYGRTCTVHCTVCCTLWLEFWTFLGVHLCQSEGTCIQLFSNKHLYLWKRTCFPSRENIWKAPREHLKLLLFKNIFISLNKHLYLP